MKIIANGYVISIRQFGKQSAIIKTLTEDYGICAGFVKNTKTKNHLSALTAGNLVEFTKTQRLSEQLGIISATLLKSYASNFMYDQYKLYAIRSALELIDQMFEENNQEVKLYQLFEQLINNISYQNNWLQAYFEFEKELLKALGYGIVLDKCGVTGSKDDLFHLSPKSGNAITYQVAKPYEDKLIPIPQFIYNGKAPDISELGVGMDLISYFIERHLISEMPTIKLTNRVLFRKLLNKT